MKRNKIKPAVTFNILRNEIKVLSWKSLKSTVRVYKQGLERSFPGIVSLFKLNCLSGPARAGHGGTLRGAECRRGAPAQSQWLPASVACSSAQAGAVTLRGLEEKLPGQPVQLTLGCEWFLFQQPQAACSVAPTLEKLRGVNLFFPPY